MSPEIKKRLTALKAGTAEHIRRGKELALVCPSGYSTLDLYFFGALNRSAALLTAFVSLIEDENLISAGPLLRLELDTSLRLYAAWLVEDPEELAKIVLSGGSIDKIKDRDGNFLRNQYLAEKLGYDDPRIQSLYMSSSGYIHLSEKHMRNAMQIDSASGEISITVSPIDKFVPDSSYNESIDAFVLCSEMVLSLTDGYTHLRANNVADS